jgi:NAD(P)-dependent dehydrogenase (short-subunit alcohol dehydrogenase family)
MLNDLKGKAVLITGGTRGIGLATGLAFGRQGAHVTLTHKWGSADEDAILRAFADAGAPAPDIVEADVANADDTGALLERIHARHQSIEVLVANVAFAQVVRGLDDYRLRDLQKSIEYTAWPLVDHTRRIRDKFGKFPRYVLGLSSGGVAHFHPNYDFVAAAKAVLETFCRYLAYRLGPEGSRVNIVSARFVRTESLRAIGAGFEELVERFETDHPFIEPEEVAAALVGMASGLMDGVSGQVLMLDHGAFFADNLMRLYSERSGEAK